MDRYIGRCVDCLVERDLGIFGAVLIQGPKWCGKTTTAQRFAESSLSLSDPSGGFAALQLARLDPAQAIVGPTRACRRMAGRTEAMGCRAIRMRCQRRGARTVHSHRICDAASREPADAQRCGSNRPFADGYHDAFRARHFVGSGLAWCAARRRSRCGVTRIHRRYRRYRGFALPRRLAPSGR